MDNVQKSRFWVSLFGLWDFRKLYTLMHIIRQKWQITQIHSIILGLLSMFWMNINDLLILYTIGKNAQCITADKLCNDIQIIDSSAADFSWILQFCTTRPLLDATLHRTPVKFLNSYTVVLGLLCSANCMLRGLFLLTLDRYVMDYRAWQI